MAGQFSGGELLLAVLSAAALVATVAYLLRRPSGGGRLEAQLDNLTHNLTQALDGATSDLGQVRQWLGALSEAQAEFRTHLGHLRERVEVTTSGLATGLAEKTFQTQQVIQNEQALLRREVIEAQKLVQEVRTELVERKQRDDQVARAVRHLEAVLAGTPSKGAAGENILDDAFSSFPPEMVERNFTVRGKVVEYALVLAGSNRRMPIDSKWPATAAIERLAEETDEAARQKTVTEVRAQLRRKIREVAQYIDPLTTTEKAIAAVPDAVYPYCGEITFEAYREGVIIMPYSMIVPYVLNLYNLHLRYSRSVDLDSLDHALSDIERNVDSLDKILDNSIQRGATMIRNAYDEVRDIVDRIRRSVVHVRALPAVAERQALTDGAVEGEVAAASVTGEAATTAADAAVASRGRGAERLLGTG